MLSNQRAFAVMGILALSFLYVLLTPIAPDEEMIDHALFRIAVEDMRGGAGYYEAMDDALAAVYGPERSAVTETIRAFRPPTMFVIFRALPDLRWVWFLFALNAAATGVAMTYLTSRHLVGIVVTAYLLSLGMLNNGGVWIAQFLTIELWAVLPMAVSIAFIIRGRPGAAAAGAGLATAVRELTAPLLGLGLLFSSWRRANRRPWITTSAVVGVGYLLHGFAARRLINPDLGEGAIEGASLVAIAEIAGFGIPGGLVVGPVLWVLAVKHIVGRYESWPVAIAPLLIPLYGLLADRPYWGILAVPFILVWGLSELVDLIQRRPVRGSATV